MDKAVIDRTKRSRTRQSASKKVWILAVEDPKAAVLYHAHETVEDAAGQ